jgi:hypothetical protein
VWFPSLKETNAVAGLDIFLINRTADPGEWNLHAQVTCQP